MATGFEVKASRGGNNESLRRRYVVESATDEEDVVDWIVANAPSKLLDLPFTGFTMEEDGEIDGNYEVEIQYGTSSRDDPEEDQVDYRFNFQAQSAHIYQSLSTINAYTTGGAARDFDGAINVVQDNGGLRAEGFNLPVPAEVFTLAYYPVNATVTPAYQLLVESLVGLVNSVAFKGRPAGSLMLTRCTGGARNNAGWSIEFGFAYIANRLNIPVGGITVAAKDGMDLLWVFYENSNDAAANSPIVLPDAAYVERIYYRDDLNLLGI